ncbi:2-alkenal reductase (NADP(+)-dependent)-like [Quercus robur]|uniref:2-alkenal reductase (NADP(+)-dependent)-like n=1 Tax=Quercus robur TaxID=38942 RepID=UPI0021614E84|nr:2-alkenal reductase (NADP(+)-dependent)-like [Quercus robur]
MAGVVESREWHLAAYAPEGVPTSDHLKLRTVTLSLDVDSIPDHHLIVQNIFISVDPYQRTLMSGLADGLYFPQTQLNEVVSAPTIARVIRSKDSSYREGDIVLNPFGPIAEYCVLPSALHLRKVDPASELPLQEFLSSLGLPGFAAWVGIEVLGDPKPGSNVFVSAAAGGVGMFAGQLAKLKGCRVIGSTGSDEKVKLIKEEFGYDDAFNYKTETDLDAALSKYFPNGIDIYFDNVGGEMLEAVLNHVNRHARIPVCGMISQYKKIWTERQGVRNLLNMVGKEVRMEGFLVGSHLNRFGDFAKEMESYIKEGKISSKLKIYHGIESYLESLGSLFTSSNFGKVIIEVKK